MTAVARLSRALDAAGVRWRHSTELNDESPSLGVWNDAQGEYRWRVYSTHPVRSDFVCEASCGEYLDTTDPDAVVAWVRSLI